MFEYSVGKRNGNNFFSLSITCSKACLFQNDTSRPCILLKCSSQGDKTKSIIGAGNLTGKERASSRKRYTLKEQ